MEKIPHIPEYDPEEARERIDTADISEQTCNFLLTTFITKIERSGNLIFQKEKVFNDIQKKDYLGYPKIN